MTTCTFLGHDSILDRDLPDRLLDAIEKVLAVDSEFEFFFYERHRLLLEAWNALQLMKRGYVDKKIRMTFVGEAYSDEKEPASRYFDKAIYPLSANHKNALIQHKRTIRWCLANSDYVISYLYGLLSDDKKWILHCAAKNSAIKVIDMTDDITRTELLVEVKCLHGRERNVLECIYAGKTVQSIAKRWGYATSSIRQLYFRASCKLIGIHRGNLHAAYLYERAGLLPGPFHQPAYREAAQGFQLGKITVL